MKEEMKELFTGYFRLTHIAVEGLRLSKNEAEAMAVGEMAQQFSKKILTDYKDLIREENYEDFKQFKIQLAVLPVDELTTLRSRVKELEEYAYHKNGCDKNLPMLSVGECTCGLDQLLTKK